MLTITIGVCLDCRVHLLNVLWGHPPSISQAGLGQHLKQKVLQCSVSLRSRQSPKQTR